MPRETFTLAQRPELEGQVRRLDPEVLPEFMLHDAVANRYWEKLYSDFPEFQIAVCEGERVVAAGHTIPISWGTEDLPDTGFDALSNRESGSLRRNALLPFSVRFWLSWTRSIRDGD